jgi:hypothetical protein
VRSPRLEKGDVHRKRGRSLEIELSDPPDGVSGRGPGLDATLVTFVSTTAKLDRPYQPPYGPPYGSWVQYWLEIEAAEVKTPRPRSMRAPKS